MRPMSLFGGLAVFSAAIAFIAAPLMAQEDPVPPDTQVVLAEVPPLADDAPTPLPAAFKFELSKQARLISQEDAWTNLQGERNRLPLSEVAGTNPWIIWKHVMALRVNEELPAASGGTSATTTTSIVQSAEDLVTSYQSMHGPGISTKFTGGLAFRKNTFTFRVDDVIDTEKLPHSYLKDLALHIVYFREGSPFAPYVIVHGPIDEFRSMVAKLQGRRIIAIGWDVKPSGN